MIFTGPRLLMIGRLIHTGCVRSASGVDKGTLSKLRKKTGFPFIKCKNALGKFDNDLVKAESWLKEQAQKEGWAKATKLEGRAMSQGLIGIIVEKNKAAMVEVNCETDFVARNSKFQRLVAQITKTCLQQESHSSSDKILMNKEQVSALPGEGDSKLSDLVAMEVGNIGENMAVRRAALLLAETEGGQLGYYIHSSTPQNFKDGVCMMGKYGAIVTFSQSSTTVDTGSESAPTNIGQQLSQHIVGMNPKSLGNVDDEPEKNKDNESKLLHQEFLLDPTLTVHEFLIQNSATVKDFVRFQCGEDLTECDSDSSKK